MDLNIDEFEPDDFLPDDEDEWFLEENDNDLII